MGGQGEGLATAVVGEAPTGQEAGAFERAKYLRNGGWGNGGSAGKVGADDLPVAHRLEGQVLRDRQCRLVRGEEALDPAAYERGCPYEGFGRLPVADVSTGMGH